jgi:hypothetical protein
MPLALRRFQDCWGSGQSMSGTVRLATNSVLEAYRQQFPSASPVIRVSGLCEVIGVRLTGVRPALRIEPSFVAAAAPPRRTGHSGIVRFPRGGVPSVEIPDGVDGYRARVAAAHEIGHVLVHKRGDKYDDVTTRLPTSIHEEAIAEYAARLLLLPFKKSGVENLASYAIRSAREAEVSIHAATCRLGDPDQGYPFLRGAVLWKLNPRTRGGSTMAERLTPAWHLCPGAFVPIGRCKARAGSLVSEVAGESASAGSVRIEDVHIGSFAGAFRVHAFAWGSASAGTRLVLSMFEALEEAGSPDCRVFPSDKARGWGEVEERPVPMPVDDQPPLAKGWL